MGDGETLQETVTSRGRDERKGDGKEGNIYRLGPTARRREEMGLNESVERERKGQARAHQWRR